MHICVHAWFKNYGCAAPPTLEAKGLNVDNRNYKSTRSMDLMNILQGFIFSTGSINTAPDVSTQLSHCLLCRALKL